MQDVNWWLFAAAVVLGFVLTLSATVGRATSDAGEERKPTDQ